LRVEDARDPSQFLEQHALSQFPNAMPMQGIE